MAGINGWKSAEAIFSSSCLHANCSKPFDQGLVTDTEQGLKYALRECLNRVFFPYWFYHL